MSHRDQTRRATGPLAFLLLLLIAAGGWNYHRNLQAEQASQDTRPYGNYSVDDLESLRDAYASELSGVQANFDSAKRNRARPVGDVGSIAGNVEQFQKTKRASSAIRAAAASVSERQEEIDALDRELMERTHFGQGLSRHLKRLIAI
jgi:hypothetical protein